MSVPSRASHPTMQSGNVVQLQNQSLMSGGNDVECVAAAHRRCLANGHDNHRTTVEGSQALNLTTVAHRWHLPGFPVALVIVQLRCSAYRVGLMPPDMA